MTSYAWLVPALPLAAAAVGFFFGRRLPGGAAAPALLGTGAALVVAAGVLASVAGNPADVHQSSVLWTPTGGITLYLGTRVDGLSAVVGVMVGVVALLVQLYSTAYMSGDARYSVYAAEVSLFTGAMLLVVYASDLIELLVGWEVMGVCSYLLIGHYWQTEGARAAAVKAFVTTRIGDVGFVFGVFALGVGAGSFEIGAVTARAGSMSHTAVVAGALLLLAGVAGKSAQFPLHVWLPDAMAGPTPISALIHAATMVAAGIYVVARLYPVYVAAPVALTVLAVIASITMLGAALVAFAQDDLKKVLAWSTVSQLAYMAGGLATGGWTAGVWHLLSHASYKALLFLAAGSVLRSVGTNFMSEMGGLRRRMPVTFWTTVVGGLALAGIPPFAGSFSKDGILDAAREAATGAAHVGVAHWAGWLVYVTGLVTALVTGAYVTRLIVRTFLGEYRGRAQVHESPWVMTLPLVVLAVAAVGLGVPGLPRSSGVSSWLDAPVGSTALSVTVAGVALTAVIALVGIAAVALAYRRRPSEDPVTVLRAGVASVLARGMRVDDAYDAAVVRPVAALARGVVDTDRGVVDRTVVGSGVGARFAGGVLRWAQNGNVQTYATGVVVVMVLVVVSVAVAK